jgi:hypothetical protein
MDKQEEYKEIVIDEDILSKNIRYEISNFGNVRKITIQNGKKVKKVLKPSICNKKRIPKFKIRFKNHSQFISFDNLLKIRRKD